MIGAILVSLLVLSRRLVSATVTVHDVVAAWNRIRRRFIGGVSGRVSAAAGFIGHCSISSLLRVSSSLWERPRSGSVF